MNSNLKNNNSSGLLAGAVLVLVGVIFLVTEYLDFDIAGAAWPLFVILPGVCLIVLGLVGDSMLGRRLTNFGAVTAAVGILLLYQNTFNHFESWAYGWALVLPVALGLSQMLYGTVKGYDYMIDGGRNLAVIGGVLFAVGLVFFEFIIGISNFGIKIPTFNGYLLPLVLIGLGVIIMIRGQLSNGSSAPDEFDDPIKQKFN